eukprot:232049_1
MGSCSSKSGAMLTPPSRPTLPETDENANKNNTVQERPTKRLAKPSTILKNEAPPPTTFKSNGHLYLGGGEHHGHSHRFSFTQQSSFSSQVSYQWSLGRTENDSEKEEDDECTYTGYALDEFRCNSQAHFSSIYDESDRQLETGCDELHNMVIGTEIL